MSIGYNENTPAQNIVIPSSTVEAAIAAFAADREAQRKHEAAMMASLITFTVTAADRLIAFAKEEAAARRAAMVREEIEAMRNERVARQRNVEEKMEAMRNERIARGNR
jgi:hypothetical protein